MKKLLLAILSFSLLLLSGCGSTDKIVEDNTLIKSQLVEITQGVSELNQDLENLNEQKALLEKQIHDLEEELKETRGVLENLVESTNHETRGVLENLGKEAINSIVISGVIDGLYSRFIADGLNPNGNFWGW